MSLLKIGDSGPGIAIFTYARITSAREGGFPAMWLSWRMWSDLQIRFYDRGELGQQIPL